MKYIVEFKLGGNLLVLVLLYIKINDLLEIGYLLGGGYGDL